MASFPPNIPEQQYWPQSIVEIVHNARNIGWSGEVQQLWKAHALMARLFAGRYRGSGRPFINHLAGTAALALRHGGDVTVVLAGYCHAAYEQGEFGRFRPGASMANRKELRAAVGDAAEALIVDYDRFGWRDMASRGNVRDTREFSSHNKQLLFLHIVNELDDSLDCGIYDAAWCEECLNRLAAGIQFANALGYISLSVQLKARVSHVRASELGCAKYGMPKQSETILNPSSRRKYLLKLTRRILRVSNKLLSD